jgi:hypothetical protein
VIVSEANKASKTYSPINIGGAAGKKKPFNESMNQSNQIKSNQSNQ